MSWLESLVSAQWRLSFKSVNVFGPFVEKREGLWLKCELGDGDLRR